MKYMNAADVLPQELLVELTRYAEGKLLYVPALRTKYAWGEKNGSRHYYQERNCKMIELFQRGVSVQEIAAAFGLSGETVRKILREKDSKEKAAL